MGKLQWWIVLSTALLLWLAIRSVMSLAAQTGAKIEVTGPLKSVCVYNNPYLSELVMDSMKKVVGEENTRIFGMKMGSEDFSRYGEAVPAVLFRLGTGYKGQKTFTKAHHDDFDICEDAMIFGVKTFVQFVTDYQNGIDPIKLKASDTRKQETHK